MSEEEKRDRGFVTYEKTYWCGGLIEWSSGDQGRCQEWIQISQGGPVFPTGWKMTKRFGPLCPKCAAVDGRVRKSHG